MAERHIEGPNAYAELRSRAAAYIGEKIVQQGRAPMKIGEVEDGGAQIDEVWRMSEKKEDRKKEGRKE